jgi:hypothetical protein
MFVANQQPAELIEPRVGPFDDLAAFVTAQLASVFIAPVPAVLAVRHNQLDAPLFSRSRSGSES